MSIEWAFVWIVLGAEVSKTPPVLSRPVATKAECEKLRKTIKPLAIDTTCAEVPILISKEKK